MSWSSPDALESRIGMSAVRKPVDTAQATLSDHAA
jgi:hypothetical protein